MVAALLSILDRLIKLLKDRELRSEKRFNDLIKPTFDDLQNVHRDYIQMFTELEEILANEGELKIRRLLKSAEKYLKKRRIEMEPLRDRLRAFGEAVSTTGPDVPQDLTSFTVALNWYFRPLEYSDAKVGIFEGAGGSIAYNLMRQLERVSSITGIFVPEEECLRVLDSTKWMTSKSIDELRRRWGDVCETYAKLQVGSHA